MIRIIVGGTVGSGKSVTAIREIMNRQNMTYTNFNIKAGNIIRMRTDMIITSEIIKTKRDGSPINELKVNWDYWNKVKDEGFDIVLDEMHSIADSRMSMTKWNVLFSQWIAQIRKILSSNESYDLILITQKLENIDIRIRRLAYQIIYCSKINKKQLQETQIYDSRSKKYKIKMLPKTYIKLYYFNGTYCVDKFEAFLCGEKTYDRQMIYLANPYFQYYDSYEILDFGDDTYV